MSNVETVKEIYAAFGRGDIQAILDKLDENVEWETAVPVEGVPWHQPRRGRGSIPGFFEAPAPLQFNRFEPHTFFETGDKVLALIEMDITSQGMQYLFPLEGHLWQFNSAGKVVKYDHVTDTALHWRMDNGR